MFENIILKEFILIIKNYPTKKEPIIETFYCFCADDSGNRLHLIKKIKEILTTDIKSFVSILAILIQQNYEQDFDDDLYNLFFYYSIIAIDNPSPITRTNGLKIINEISLFQYRYQRVLQKIEKF